MTARPMDKVEQTLANLRKFVNEHRDIITTEEAALIEVRMANYKLAVASVEKKGEELFEVMETVMAGVRHRGIN